jgi:hypothetical protein
MVCYRAPPAQAQSKAVALPDKAAPAPSAGYEGAGTLRAGPGEGGNPHAPSAVQKPGRRLCQKAAHSFGPHVVKWPALRSRPASKCGGAQSLISTRGAKAFANRPPLDPTAEKRGVSPARRSLLRRLITSPPSACWLGRLAPHPYPYFQAKNRQGTGSRALPCRAAAGFNDRGLLLRRNLTDAAGNFLLGLLLGTLGVGDKERIQTPALCGNAPPVAPRQVTVAVHGACYGVLDFGDPAGTRWIIADSSAY